MRVSFGRNEVERQRFVRVVTMPLSAMPEGSEFMTAG